MSDEYGDPDEGSDDDFDNDYDHYSHRDRWMDRVMRDMERRIRRFERRLGDTFSSIPLPEFEEGEPGREGQAWGPYVHGFSLKVGPDGIPKIRTFGNVPRLRTHKKERDIRAPYVDVMVREAHNIVTILAEMPGVEKEDVELTASERSLDIKAERGDRKYATRVSLPVAVDETSAKAKYNNGVLEVTLKLKERRKPSGKRVQID